jgi:hypothetical protein
MSVAIFIDANRYLELFEVDGGKELLDNLEEQMQYIFVSKPVADEVMRRMWMAA